jgi:hypothetical protein
MRCLFEAGVVTRYNNGVDGDVIIMIATQRDDFFIEDELFCLVRRRNYYMELSGWMNFLTKRAHILILVCVLASMALAFQPNFVMCIIYHCSYDWKSSHPKSDQYLQAWINFI